MRVALVAILFGLALVAEAQFDRRFVGVCFSPYTDNLPGRQWNQYSVNDIMDMLRVIRSKFNAISTYSMGTASYNRGKPWDQADSNALIARAAARLNRQGGERLNVNIGVYQVENADRQREIDNAYAAARDANGISRGTVWGITYTNEYVVDARTANEVLDMINRNRGRDGLKVGPRVHRCDLVSDNGEAGQRFKDIIRASDFIYCNVYASKEHAQLGPERAAREVINYFIGLRNSIRGVKGSIDVQIGETGWPSAGNSFNDSDNTTPNLVKYWEAIARLARERGIKVQMFQAIDEPWKAQNSQWKGEGKYGWWYKPDNKSNRLVEKKTGR